MGIKLELKTKYFFCLLFVLFICINTLFSEEKTIEIFLENYFNTNDYVYEKHIIANKPMFVAIAFKDKVNLISDDCIVFMINEEKYIKPLLFIRGSKSTNHKGDAILSVRFPPNVTFGGWKIGIRKNSILIDPYTNRGEVLTDGIGIVWNENQSAFLLKEQDRSQW